MTTPRPEPLLFGDCRCDVPCTEIVCPAYLATIHEAVAMHVALRDAGLMMLPRDDDTRVVVRGRVGGTGPLRFVTRTLWNRVQSSRRDPGRIATR